MQLKKLSLFVSLLGCFLMSEAQFITSYLLAADKYFAAGDYYSAAQYYEKYLGQQKNKTGQQSFQPYAVAAGANKNVSANVSSHDKVIYNLAESYRQLHYHEKALPYYAQAVTFNKTAFPLAKFYYATTLRALEKYEEAAAAFTEFKAEYAADDMYKETATRELQNLAFIRQQMARTDLAAYTVKKSSSLNAEGGNYAPAWVNDTLLWFTSTRAQTDDKNKTNTNRIYQAGYYNNTAGSVSTVNIPQAKNIQQGVTAATPDGKMLFITRWEIAKNKKTASVFTSKWENGSWSEPIAATALNAAGSNTQQPMVMPDGKALVFASDRAGGQGGFDLWMSSLDANGNFGTPVNLGATINTKYDEQAPAYHAASNTLVFSSNGRTGMGGYDFFYSKGSLTSLTEPVNFGYPVNSVKDDLYFTSRGSATNILENVVFSSDRQASCCLELFSLNKEKPLKQISGVVISCVTNQPLAEVQVVIYDSINNKAIAQLTTDAAGKYAYSLPEFVPLKATASNSGYYKNSIQTMVPADAESVMFSNPVLCLNPITTEAVRVENVYYDYNKATLQEASFPELDKLVSLLNDNPNMTIELGAHTDSKGADAYNLKLSDARANSVVEYLVSKGIDRSRLVAKGYGETSPVAENTNSDGSDNPEGRQQNRRTEFRVLKN